MDSNSRFPERATSV